MGSCDADVQLCEIAKGKLFTDPRCADALYLVGVDWPTWLLMYWRASRYISTLSIRITCLMLWLLIINTWYTSACLLCMLTSLNKHSASFVQVILDFDWPLCNIVLLPQDSPNTESGTLNSRTRTYTVLRHDARSSRFQNSDDTIINYHSAAVQLTSFAPEADRLKVWQETYSVPNTRRTFAFVRFTLTKYVEFL